MTLTLPPAVQQWIERFQQEQWSGSLTLHFNRGSMQSYEPKPNCRLDVK